MLCIKWSRSVLIGKYPPPRGKKKGEKTEEKGEIEVKG
jgi:hypothetical protein